MDEGKVAATDLTEKAIKEVASNFVDGSTRAHHANGFTGEPSAKRQRVERAIPTKEYLDYTIKSVLLHALYAVEKERPVDPIQYLAEYLMQQKQDAEKKENTRVDLNVDQPQKKI